MGKFRPKKSNSFFFAENWHTQSISRMQIFIPTLVFSISDRKSIFWANLCWKSRRHSFCLKIGIQVISRMLILIATLVFWISNPKYIFGQILTEKVKVLCFDWKLEYTHTHTHTHTNTRTHTHTHAHRVSHRCWLLFRH